MKAEITQCSYCKKYQNPVNEEWQIEAPEGTVQGIDGNITHGICPKCLEKVMEEI